MKCTASSHQQLPEPRASGMKPNMRRAVLTLKIPVMPFAPDVAFVAVVKSQKNALCFEGAGSAWSGREEFEC
jgi:hypothetical protein